MSQCCGFRRYSASTLSVGMRELRQVVHEVVQQDLRGQHGQKRQEQRSTRHAEHVAEVRAGTHQQVLHYVAEGLAPFEDAAGENVEAGLDEDNVGGFTGHVHGRCDRDAHVGRVQRRSIVDSIAHVSDDVAAMFQRHDDAVLLRRRHPREDRGHLGDVRQRGIAHALQFIAEHDLARFEADLAADVRCDEVPIAGDDLHLHSVPPQRGQGFGGIRQRRVGKGQKTCQD